MIIEIPGNPIAQVRHRHRLLNTGKVLVYDPQAREKHLIKRVIEEELSAGEIPVYKYPDVAFTFFMPIPLRMRKAEKLKAQTERMRHVHKPDVDNLVKLYLDCLLGTVLHDDRVVSISGAVKLYSPRPRVIISIVEGQEMLLPDSKAHDDQRSLKCDEPSSLSIEIPPYSEAPFHSDELRDLCKLAPLRDKGSA